MALPTRASTTANSVKQLLPTFLIPIIGQVQLLILLGTTALTVRAEEAGYDDNDARDDGGSTSGVASAGEDSEPNGFDWMSVAVALGPGPLVAIVAVLIVANFLVVPDLCTRALMVSYRTEGSVVDGTVLSYRPISAPASTAPACDGLCKAAKSMALLDDDIDDAATKPTPTPSRYLAEIMYEAIEHKYMDNPSLKFRNPGAYETKRFVRTFDFSHLEDFGPGSLARGDRVPVLLLRGINNTRSGCPQHVVDRIYDSFPWRQIATVLVVATAALIVLLAITIRNSMTRLEDPRRGWAVLLGVVVGGDLLGLLVALDRFLKLKRTRFDGALPMVSAVDQREAMDHKRHEEEASGLQGRGDPFKIPLHEFAGHARASERHRFD